jgi:hypothetical protein
MLNNNHIAVLAIPISGSTRYIFIISFVTNIYISVHLHISHLGSGVEKCHVEKYLVLK